MDALLKTMAQMLEKKMFEHIFMIQKSVDYL